MGELTEVSRNDVMDRQTQLLSGAMSVFPFSFRLDPDLKEAVFKEARLEGRPVSELMRQATREYIERMNRFRVRVGELEEEADKGIFISGEAMRAWIESWDTENELPPPEPDIFPDKSSSGK